MDPLCLARHCYVTIVIRMPLMIAINIFVPYHSDMNVFEQTDAICTWDHSWLLLGLAFISRFWYECFTWKLDVVKAELFWMQWSSSYSICPYMDVCILGVALSAFMYARNKPMIGFSMTLNCFNKVLEPYYAITDLRNRTKRANLPLKLLNFSSMLLTIICNCLYKDTSSLYFHYHSPFLF